MTKRISDGVPKQECVAAFIDNYKRPTIVIVMSLAFAVLNFAAAIACATLLKEIPEFND